MFAVRLVCSVAIGFAIYWIVEKGLSMSYGSGLDLLAFYLSPLSIFGWTFCVLLMIGVYFAWALIRPAHRR